jgi:hypothetical protein
MPDNTLVPLPSTDRFAAFRALKVDLAARAAARVQSRPDLRILCGLPELDAALGGGWIPGSVATLEGASGSGRMAIAARLLAHMTHRGLAAAIDDGTLFPPALARAGVRLDRLLIVPASSALSIARAVDIVLRSRAFGVVLMPAIALRAQVWSRLAGLAQKAGAVLLALGERVGADLAAFAATRIGCVLDRVLVAGAGGVFTRLAGYEVRARVLKQRGVAPGTSVRVRVLQRNEGVVLRERAMVLSRRREALV